MGLQALVLKYGLSGLFLSAFMGSTIFIPFSVEVEFPILFEYGISPYQVVAIATVGAMLGSWVNYILGYYGAHIVEKHVKSENSAKVKRWMNRYGWLALFIIVFAPLPLPTDPMTVFCGITKMNFVEYTVIVLAAKLLKYAMWAGLISLVFF